MADQSIQDVVNQAQSVGDPSPSDVPASTTDYTDTEGGVDAFATNNTNDSVSHEISTHVEDLEDQSQPIQIHATEDRQARKDSLSVRDSRNHEVLKVANHEQELKANESDITYLVSASREIDVTSGATGLDGPEESAIQQALADASGGSDTDASRPGTSADVRSSTVKKPTSFKAVSVTKNFLAKAAGSTPLAKSATDKASFSSANSSGTSLQQSSRPRLVAKSASGLRDSAPKSKKAGNRGGPGGPDPTQVWNKNRPVQVPPPKHLTDEELKQQYGIHMTSRIQADGEGKEAKWADIDDDEDDWAPETIEWNDGTKVTLTQSENIPVATQESIPAVAVLEEEKDTDTFKAIVARPSSSVGPNATVLKLGASRDGMQGKAGSLTLRGTTDFNNTTSTKSAAPPPSKSPWAALPPVDKISPVTINPPMPASTRPYNRDGQGYDQMASMQQPAREMAADDFNRNWRDSQSGATRELFNSQSGRYEPVQEGRRGSRNDQQFRPPSLLQRPTQNEQPGPAEPSAAFQTYRTSTQDGMWGRRRNSSNVSGGSGSFGRRMSLGKMPDLPSIPNDPNQQRRDSQQTGSSDRVASPRTLGYPHSGKQNVPFPPRDASPGPNPSLAQQQSQGSPASQYTQPSSPAGPNQYRPPGQGDAPVQPQQFQGEDPVAMQQRIMREKREEARKRRIEQEEKEEAEKRERIRLKLEAMGPPPSEKKEKAVEAPITSPQPSDAPTQSPPKPPVPGATGEPMQYGMMKVHHPDSVKKMTATAERAHEGTFDGNNQSRRISSPAKPDMNKTSPPAQANGIRPVNDQLAGHHQPELQSRNLANDKIGQPWNNTQAPNVGVTAASPWGAARVAGHPSSGGNLWGPPTNDKDRALGNGTFDRAINTFPTRDGPLRNHLKQPDQPPMAVAGKNDSSAVGAIPQHSFTPLPSQSSENLQPIPAFPSPEKRSIVKNSEQDHIMQTTNPGPIGPPSGRLTGTRWQPQPTASRPATTSAWNNFHSVAQRDEVEQNEKYQRELAARLEEEQRTGIRHAPPAPPITETWRQVEIGEDANSRNVVRAAKSNHNVQQTLQQVPGFGPVGSIPGAERSVGNPLNLGRGSRFFPHQGDSVQPQGRRAASYSPGHVLTPPSPPPEGRAHPVFDGEDQRPIVNLPHPKPVVKLPSAAISPPASISFSPPPPTTPSLRVSSLPTASTVSWQDRFNGLLGKKTSPEKTHVLAVTSATKEPLENMALGAAVSLPKQDDEYHSMIKDAGKIASKDVEEEEAIFEDREAGSLPIVRLPHIPLQAAWQRARPPASHPKQKYYKPVQARSIEPFAFSPTTDSADSNRLGITIYFTDMATPITVPMPGKPGVNNHPRQRNASSTYNKPRKGGPNNKSRESSGSYSASQNASKEHTPTINGTVGKPRSDFRKGGWAKTQSVRTN